MDTIEPADHSLSVGGLMLFHGVCVRRGSCVSFAA